MQQIIGWHSRVQVVIVTRACMHACKQAATGKEVLDARWRKREAEHCARTGADSLPPRWFELRAPDSLQRPHGEGLRYRSILCIPGVSRV